MDIAYLLFLQDFRNGIDNALTPFMEWVSFFAVTYIVLLSVNSTDVNGLRNYRR